MPKPATSFWHGRLTAPRTQAKRLGLLLLLSLCLAPGAPAAPACDPRIASCLKPPPLIPGLTPPPASCGPAVGGSPSLCGGSGPASLGNTSGTEQGAGNPLNLITGNKYQREVDMPALPGVLGLEIVRHYNSLYSLPNVPPGLFGRGWKLSYETRLHPGPHSLQIVQADGSRVTFDRDPANPSLCSSADPAQGQIHLRHSPNLDGGVEYRWRWPDGRELLFDARGLLLQIHVPSGESLSLLYAPDGSLVRVIDPQGRSLSLVYPPPRMRSGTPYQGVHAIDSPLGRFEYRYGSPPVAGSSEPARLHRANLVSVQLPNAAPNPSPPVLRRYHYEDPRFATLLTGLSLEGGAPATAGTAAAASTPAASQRLASWGYDANARANLSVKGWPARLQTGPDGQPLSPARLIEGSGIEQVTLQRLQPGQTLLTNSLGQSTTYRHAIVANQWRLLESRGAGCASCGPANIRYDYDAQGRLIGQTQLSPGGQPLSRQHTMRERRFEQRRIEREQERLKRQTP